jgi:hypothetical protein
MTSFNISNSKQKQKTIIHTRLQVSTMRREEERRMRIIEDTKYERRQ